MQDRCMVWMHSMDLLGGMGHVESCFGLFGNSVSGGADRCTVWTKCTIGSEIVLDVPDGTPWVLGSSGSSIQSVWR
jgi:hypothetical protein